MINPELKGYSNSPFGLSDTETEHPNAWDDFFGVIRMPFAYLLETAQTGSAAFNLFRDNPALLEQVDIIRRAIDWQNPLNPTQTMPDRIKRVIFVYLNLLEKHPDLPQFYDEYSDRSDPKRLELIQKIAEATGEPESFVRLIFVKMYWLWKDGKIDSTYLLPRTTKESRPLRKETPEVVDEEEGFNYMKAGFWGLAALAGIYGLSQIATIAKVFDGE